jgi:hypothetical protein
MNELPSTAVGALRLMPSTTKEIAAFAHQIINSVRNGEANALEVLVMLKALELLSKEVIEQIEENIVNAADKYSEKEFEVFGAKVVKAENAVRYNYLQTNDIEYERLHAEAEAANRKLKEREEFLRALKEPMTSLNEETGEVYKITPPFKTSKSGVKVYLKNK